MMTTDGQARIVTVKVRCHRCARRYPDRPGPLIGEAEVHVTQTRLLTINAPKRLPSKPGSADGAWTGPRAGVFWGPTISGPAVVLRCRRCRAAPAVSRERLDQLIVAAARSTRVVYLDPRGGLHRHVD